MPKKFGVVYTIAKDIARIPVSVLTRRHWAGEENLPKEGGFIVAPNHISEFDSMTFQHYMVNHKYPVRILCKAELFRLPVLGWIFKTTKQIPVYRQTDRSSDALVDAQRALLDGECVVLYPEGTLTRDPDFWPMKGKSGAARLALQTRRPVIPVVQWGAQDVYDRYGAKPSLSRKDVWVRALPEVDLSDLYDRADDPAAWTEATDRIIKTLHFALAQIRKVTAPEYAPVDPKDPATPTKKELALAHKLWRAEHPKALPSLRTLGQFAQYTAQARVQLEAKAEDEARDVHQTRRESGHQLNQAD